MRVASNKLRIFPLVAMRSPQPYPYLDQLLTQLADDGITGRIVAVDYEFQAGGNQMLVCQHAEDWEDAYVARCPQRRD